MQRTLRRLLEVTLLLLAYASSQAMGQAPAVPSAPAPPRNLSELEGLYDYRDGLTLFIVASGGGLVAVIGEAKYPLRAAGIDTFTNASGDLIPFLRDADGRIVAFQERGDTFRRRSTLVAAATRSLFEPRPKGPDGRPVAYRYEQPPRLPDGIRVGEAGSGTISPEVAARLVHGVMDGSATRKED